MKKYLKLYNKIDRKYNKELDAFDKLYVIDALPFLFRRYITNITIHAQIRDQLTDEMLETIMSNYMFVGLSINPNMTIYEFCDWIASYCGALCITKLNDIDWDDFRKEIKVK